MNKWENNVLMILLSKKVECWIIVVSTQILSKIIFLSAISKLHLIRTIPYY